MTVQRIVVALGLTATLAVSTVGCDDDGSAQPGSMPGGQQLCQFGADMAGAIADYSGRTALADAFAIGEIVLTEASAIAVDRWDTEPADPVEFQLRTPIGSFVRYEMDRSDLIRIPRCLAYESLALVDSCLEGTI